MNYANIRRTYLTLLTLNTLAASFIWGINTLFLLDAGLNNTEAFSANAFFTAGMVLFDVPTGMVADMWGRKLSYLLGALTLAVATAFYLWLWHVHATFWPWAIVSVFLGLGFTFFSGAFEAWLVDALTESGLGDKLESVFAKAEVVNGSAMLLGTITGGIVAQKMNLGVPYVLRILAFIITFIFAWIWMQDFGFTPKKGKAVVQNLSHVWKNSIRYGLGRPPVRWLMLAVPFTNGVMIYVFYAMQPYLLKLYGNEKAYSVAGFAAAIIAASQIVGGLISPYIKRIIRHRTSALFFAILCGSVVLALIGWTSSFWPVIFLLIVFGLLISSVTPSRQMYLNGLIPSEQRATVLSFDSLMGSGGAVVIQPLLGRAADLWGYPISYLAASAFQLLALPFIALAYKEKAPSDKM